MITIVIADDHPMILKGLSETIQSDPSLELLATASAGDELIRQIESQEPDIVLCDINMPVKTGLEVLGEVKQKELSCKFIILSVHEEKPIIEKAFRLGAYGYLLKSSKDAEVLDAIRVVASGKKYFSEEVMSITMKMDKPIEDSQAKIAMLTERELEIINLIVDGFSNAEIGEKLFISKRTVDAHRNNVLQKLLVKNTAQLVRFALQSGLCD